MRKLFFIGVAVSALCAPLASANTSSTAQITQLQNQVLALQSQVASLQAQGQQQSISPADVAALIATGG